MSTPVGKLSLSKWIYEICHFLMIPNRSENTQIETIIQWYGSKQFWRYNFSRFFQSLKWPKISEDSSDFGDFWTELIVMTRTFILVQLRFFFVIFFFTPWNWGWGVREIQIQRKSKRKRKQKRKWGNLRGGHEAPPPP